VKGHDFSRATRNMELGFSRWVSLRANKSQRLKPMRKLVRGTTKTHALSLACLWKHNTSPPQKTAEGGCATALQAGTK
jgi:hypothetical protein